MNNEASRREAEPVIWEATGDYRWLVRGRDPRALDAATGGRARVLQRKHVSKNRKPQLVEWRDVPVTFETI